MSTTAKKTARPADDLDIPEVDVSKMKRNRSRFAHKRLELPLSDVRRAANKTQVQVSEASGISQGEISKIENRDDLEVISIATLRRYVEALGGRLELAATFPNGACVVIATR